MVTAISFMKTRSQFTENRNELLFGLGSHGPDNICVVLVAGRDPFCPSSGIFKGDGLPVSLVVYGYRKNNIILTGDLNNRINMREISFVRSEGIIIQPWFFTIYVCFGPITDTHQHCLNKNESIAFGFLKD